jgi:asparagine synthase (glutamine-hydrolysing)
LYFHDAPDVLEFQKETIALLENVHKFDVLRADRCTAGNGLELRVPFFDKTFREYVVSMHPKFKKTSIEKYILRKAFDLDYLPECILYRQKNGMSDAVGYSWVDHIRSYAESTISTDEFIKEKSMYTHNSPVSKEELMYRKIYDKFYKKVDLIPHIWRPKYTDILDPSAKMLCHFTDFTQQDEPKESLKAK